jgi:hypothetical protein
LILWRNLPRDGGDPDGPIRDAVDRRFTKPPSGARRAREEIMTKQGITQFLPTEFTYADDDGEHFWLRLRIPAGCINSVIYVTLILSVSLQSSSIFLK